jgi:putative addiction module component (TIGR02574 family)
MVKEELLEQILALPPADRLYILHLLESLGDDLPPQLNPDDQKEMLKRVDEARKHPERMLTWEQVKEKLAAQRRRPSA